MDINAFQVYIYGNLTPFEKNPLLSMARVRIFYKGLNRNRTFITDEFAEKLISSLPYTPVSGIWDDDTKDFTDHGESREEGRIYGLVPENPNVKWELHTDEDGVEREYCCCDVALFTSRYKESLFVIGKPQSMEIYRPSIKGEWIYLDGVKCFRYTEGCFIGLQVLGDDVEPCFEGAAFYTYANSLKEMVDLLKNYTVNGGSEQMVLNFNLSDREKFDAIWALLNPNYCEEGNWTVNFSVMDVFDEYVLAYEYETHKMYKYLYTKNDETNEVTLGEHEEVFQIIVTEAEKKALESLKTLNDGIFTEIDSKYLSVTEENSTLKGENEKLDGTITELNQKIEGLNDTISVSAETIEGLNTKIGEQANTIQEMTDAASAAEGELSQLREFKKGIEIEEKKAEIAKYSMLSEEVIQKCLDNVENYTLKELQDVLKIEYVNANAQSIFSNNSNQSASHLIPKVTNNSELTGAARLINNHKNNGGK